MALNLFDHHPSPAPPNPRPEGAGGEPVVKDDKADSHRQLIIVLASVAAVVIAWFTYRKLANPTATTTAGTATVPTLGTGTVTGSSGAPDNSAIAGFGAYLNTIQSEIAALTDASAAGNGGPTTMLPGPGPDYSGTTNKLLYDLRTATYGQVQANGSVDWLTNTQAAIVGATQANSTQVSDAGRLSAPNQNITNLPPPPPTPAPTT